MDQHQEYAAFFRFARRPFSLTPDPRFYFRSRSHGRVFDAISAALSRRDGVMVIAGDLGVGKTTLCRTLVDSQERKLRATLIGNALLSPEDLLRLMIQDLGVVPLGDPRHEEMVAAPLGALLRQFDRFLLDLADTQDGVLVIIDEAHSLPPATLDQLIEITNFESNRRKVFQVLLAGQPAVRGGGGVARGLDEHKAPRARLLPFERDECERYVHHRLTIAGGAAVSFEPPAIETIYALSGGVARLVNLLCERALQEAAAAKTNRIEASMISAAASALDLLRLKPRRFRWYGTR